MLTSRFVLWDLVRVLFATVALVQVIAYVISRFTTGEPMVIPWSLMLGIMGLLICLAVIAVVGVFQNHYGARFRLGPAGVMMAVTARERRINRVLFWVALLSGKPNAMGAAMIAQSQEERQVDWDDVRGMKVYPRPRVITLAGSQRTLLRLYCPPELFDEAVARCRASLVAAERRRQARHERPPRPWTRWLMAGALIAVVTVVAAVDTWPDKSLSPLALAAGLAAILALPLAPRPRTVVALAGLAVALTAAGLLARDAWQLVAYPWGGGLRAYHYATGRLLWTAAGTVALVTAHVLLLVPSMTGRGKERRHDQ